MEENKYSVKDLCSIFNINANTFPSIAKRLGINSDEYCVVVINEFKSPKKYYNELAYKKVEEYILSKQKSNKVKEKEVSKYLQKIEDKEKIINDLRQQLEFTQKFLVAEKGEKQQLQKQINLLAEDNKKITELETKNEILKSTNESYMEKNHSLEQEKYNLQEELERLKNRGFFARLFNK